MDELAAAAGQNAVACRRALLDKSPRAKVVLELAAEKADWGRALSAAADDYDLPAGPPTALPGITGGERLATDNRQLGYTRWKAFPSDRVPSQVGDACTGDKNQVRRFESNLRAASPAIHDDLSEVAIHKTEQAGTMTAPPPIPNRPARMPVARSSWTTRQGTLRNPVSSLPRESLLRACAAASAALFERSEG